MTSPSAVKLQPAATSATTLLLGALAMLLLPLTTLGAGVLFPYRVPGTYLTVAVLHLGTAAILARGAWSWWGATRGPRPRDAAPPIMLALGVGASLLLIRLIAAQHGILGSALPRVRYGAPMDVDVPYLASVGLGMLALLLALVWLALLPLRRSPGRGAGRPEGTRGRAASAPPAEKPLVLGPPRPVVTSSADGLLRRVFSPLALVLLALGIAVSVAALLLFSLGSPTEATAEPLTVVVAFAAAPSAAWAVLASLWRKDEDFGIVVAALLRTMVAPLATGVLLVVPLLIAAAFPAVREGFQAHSLALIGDDGLLEAGAPLAGWVAMCALVTVMVGMLAGLTLSVAVVFPGMAVLFPQEVVGENDLSTRPEDLRRNIAAVRALSLLVVLIFVFSWLIVDARVGEGRFWLAMATLAAMAVLTVLIVRWQRRAPTSETEDAPDTSATASTEDGIGTNGPDQADPPATPKQW